MSKSYTVSVLSSLNVGGTADSYTFNHDFSHFDEGEYEVMGRFMSVSALAVPLTVSISGIGKMESYLVSSSSQNEQSSIIGCVRNTNHSFVDFSPVFMNRRPVGTSFRVEFRNISSNDLTSVGSDWMLLLTFKKSGTVRESL